MMGSDVFNGAPIGLAKSADFRTASKDEYCLSRLVNDRRITEATEDTEKITKERGGQGEHSSAPELCLGLVFPLSVPPFHYTPHRCPFEERFTSTAPSCRQGDAVSGLRPRFLYARVCTRLANVQRVPFFFSFFLRRHVRRLRASAQRVNLEVPFDDDALAQRIEDTVAAAGDLREADIRVLLTRGVGELTYDLGATPAPSLVIIVKPLEEPPARVAEQGIRISVRCSGITGPR